jgi:hypothetical protein
MTRAPTTTLTDANPCYQSSISPTLIVVDTSIWLHQIVSVIDEVALFLLIRPSYRPARLTRKLWRHHKVLLDFGLKPIDVFYGR